MDEELFSSRSGPSSFSPLSPRVRASAARRSRRRVGDGRPVGLGGHPDELKLLKQVLRGFQKTFPQIKVDYAPITGDYVPAMLAKFAARKPPDVFYVDSNVFPDWVKQGLLQPLNSYVDEEQFSSKPFYARCWRASSYKGKIYGFPKDWSPLAMEINTDLPPRRTSSRRRRPGRT